MTDLEAFRRDTRAWLEANCPLEMRQPVRDETDMCWGGRNPIFKNDAQRRWMEVMAERGWTVPDWPTDYGGGGLSPAETETRRLLRSFSPAPGTLSMALIIVGTLVSTVGWWRAIISNSFSGVERSEKRTVSAPTANGKSRLVPVA